MNTTRHASQHRDGHNVAASGTWRRKGQRSLSFEQEDAVPIDPAYLRDPITLRLSCGHCLYTRLHECSAVSVKSVAYQKVETCCLGCGHKVTK